MSIYVVIEKKLSLHGINILGYKEKGCLTDACLDRQDTFRKRMFIFDIQSQSSFEEKIPPALFLLLELE